MHNPRRRDDNEVINLNLSKLMDIRTDNIDDIKALMANVLDGHNGENLYSYLSKFNQLNVGYVASAKSAREAVPEIFRKTGLYLTYYIDSKPTTEIFIGDKTAAGTEETWIADDNWEFSDGIGQIDSNSITLNQLSKEVLDLICANNEINIVNYPDGEDLTEFDVCGGNSKRAVNALKFANKEYNPANFSGLGRIYLRKNIVDDKNILTQDMINKENTIYIVQYDYDLNDQTITIPDKSILVFYGGHFNNGNLKCTNTYFTNIIKLSDIGTVSTSGTFVKGQILVVDNELSWFNGTQWVKFNSDTTEIDDENLSDSFKNRLPDIDNIQLTSNIQPGEITTKPESGDYLIMYAESFSTHTHKTYVPIKTINNESVIGEGNINTIKAGDTPSRPTNVSKGFQYFDTTLEKPIYWNGAKWVDSNGNNADAYTFGITGDRPSNVKVGFMYFDSSINKPIWWNGTEWVDNTGASV